MPNIDKSFGANIVDVKIKHPIRYISPSNAIERGDVKKFDRRNDAFLKPNAESTKKIIEKFKDIKDQQKFGIIEVARYVKENLDRNRSNERVLAPLAANIELFVEQNYRRYKSNKKSINLLQIDSQPQKIDISLVPLNKGGKIGGVQVKDMEGNQHLFMPVKPSQLHPDQRSDLIKVIRNQAREVAENAVEDLNSFPQWESWQHKIEDPNNDDTLWLPIDPNQPGKILINEHTLQTYLKVECFKDLNQEQAKQLAEQYDYMNKLWDNEKSKSIEEDKEILETDLFSSQSINAEEIHDSQLSEAILLETGYQNMTEKKTQNQDCVYVGKNPDGMRVMAVFDGVSASSKGHVLAQMLAECVATFSGKNKNSLLNALNIGFKKTRAELDMTSHNAAATGTAGLIDNDNMLHLLHKGDTRAYLIRDGKMRLLTPIQNEKTTKIRDLMSANPNMTKSEARKKIELVFQKLRNTPNVYNIDENLNEGGIVYITEQLQPGDQLIFSSDGAFDNMQTLEAEERYILEASKQKNPATYLGNAANSLRKQQGKAYRDDLGIGYMRIKSS